MKKAFISALMFAAACGSSSSGDDDDVPADTAQQQSTIETVTPCTGESATVITQAASVYVPKDTTISVGQIVKFEMNPMHDVAPKTAADDPNLKVGLGQTKCLKFTAAGTFNFKCSPHGFTGSITVQ
jgi:plastocyanin